ncbi:hypothetical protein CF8_0047 [Aeromonas phage CF8]|nr:hypothetical protein CF8_0047 [Aeromonas phage CF8]
MWVCLNTFNYEELLNVIIKEKNLADEIITMDLLSDIFTRIGVNLSRKNMSPPTDHNAFLDLLLVKLQKVRNGLLTEDGRETLIDFICSLDKPFNETHEFFDCLNLVKSYCGFVNDDKQYTIIISKDEIEDLETAIDIKLGNFFNPIEEDDSDIVIEHAIRDLLYPEEQNPSLTWDLRVMNTPGKVVKHGDHLITFPTLFAIVRPQL